MIYLYPKQPPKPYKLISYGYGSFIIAAGVPIVYGLLILLGMVDVHFNPGDSSALGMITGIVIALPLLFIHVLTLIVGITITLILRDKLLIVFSILGLMVMAIIFCIFEFSLTQKPFFQFGPLDIMDIWLIAEVIYVGVVLFLGIPAFRRTRRVA